MPDINTFGRWLIIGGVGLVLLGLAVLLLGKVPFFGRLPGDLRIQGERFSCLVPIASSLILSIILTIVLNVVVRLLNR
jgi:hypothetical protein